MSDSESHEISMSVAIDAPPDEVWIACSSQEPLRTWFNDTLILEPRLDGTVQFDGSQGDEVYHVRGRIVDFEAPRRVTIEGTWEPCPTGEPTLLSLELAPADGNGEQTQVTLRHHGFERLPSDQREATYEYFHRFWDRDELLPLKMYVEGVGPSY